MYLVGRFHNRWAIRAGYKGFAVFVEELTQEHYMNAKNFQDYQIINMAEGTFFDPNGKDDKWLPFKEEEKEENLNSQ